MMKENRIGNFTYGDGSYDFEFTTSLSAYEKLIFVRNVVNNLVDDNSYDFVLRDLVFDFIIIDMFTNIDTSFVNEKDEDGNEINPIIIMEHFLNNTNIVDVVKENMEAGLLDELNRAVDLDIRYVTGVNTNPLSESIANLVSTLEKKIDGVDLDSMMRMANKFSGMTEDFTLENIVNAYMNSDIHQKNLAEIKEAKEA